MKIDRRGFLQTAAAALAMTGASYLQSAETTGPIIPKKLIWGNLLHWGHNMWGDTTRAYTPPTDHFDCDIPLWNELTKNMADSGLNMILIDLGEGIQYQSHPELGIKGAWPVEKFRQELARLRKLGLEPIPKLNFSTCHDVWLGDYARMVSTPKYYRSLCRSDSGSVCHF